MERVHRTALSTFVHLQSGKRRVMETHAFCHINMEGLEEESNCDSLERGDDSNDGSNIDSENIDSIDSLGPSDSASERVDSAVGGLLMDGDELRGESRVEGSNEDDDDVDNIDGVSGDRYTANPDQANVVDDKMVGGKVNPRENLRETVGRSSPAKVSCDIDDDEAINVPFFL